MVTGASGFTGSHLVHRLVEDGAEVVAFVRRTSDCRWLRRLGVECRTVDLREKEQVKRQFEGVRTVYHLAAAFRTQHADPSEFRMINVGATRHVLAAARCHGVERFVHCSTVGVHGEIDDPPADEEYRMAPGDDYQKSKLEGERLARQAMLDGAMEVTVVRPVGIYGPGDRRFLKLFRPIARRRFVMVGSGETLYHLTYVDDLVEGLLLAGRHPAGSGEVFIVGGPRYTTLNELASLIARSLGVPEPRLHVPYAPVHFASVLCNRFCRLLGMNPFLYPRRVEFFEKDRAFDISKARRVLGYEPRVDLEEGLARTAAWYREQDLL